MTDRLSAAAWRRQNRWLGVGQQLVLVAGLLGTPASADEPPLPADQAEFVHAVIGAAHGALIAASILGQRRLSRIALTVGAKRLQ